MLKLKKISLVLEDVETIEKSYMPFIENGGLLITTGVRLDMGDELNLDVSLLSENCRYIVEAKVVLVDPSFFEGEGEGEETMVRRRERGPNEGCRNEACRNEGCRPRTRVGVQFLGRNALTLRAQIQSLIQFSPTPNSAIFGQRSTDFKSL